MAGSDETYLGDGLYASFDGFSFVLRAPRELRGGQPLGGARAFRGCRPSTSFAIGLVRG